MQAYGEQLQAYMQTTVEQLRAATSIYSGQLQANSEAYNTQVRLAESLHNSQLQGALGMVSEYVKVYLQGFVEYMGLYARTREIGQRSFEVTAGLKQSMATSFAEMQSRLYAQVLGSKIEALRVVGGMQGDLVERMAERRRALYTQTHESEVGTTLKMLEGREGMFQQLFQSFFEGTLRTRLQEKAERVGFVGQGVGVIAAKEASRVEAQKAAAMLMAEVGRMAATLRSEQYVTNLEYDVKNIGWDMELFQMAGNVLSAGSGSVVPTAGKPSRTQTALGGALSGAAIGASIGGPAAPLAAGIGAVAGGVGGLLLG